MTTPAGEHSDSFRQRVALATTEFPSASQTFVEDQIRGLPVRGFDVDVFPSHAGPAPDVLRRARELGLMRAVRYPPDPRYVRGGPLAALALQYAKPVLLARAPRLWRSGEGSLGRLRQLAIALPFAARAGAYRLVHVHFGYRALTLLPLFHAGLLRAPLVVSFHGHDIQSYARRYPGVYQPLFAAAASVVANGQYMRTLLLALGAPPDKIRVIPNGVRTGEIRFQERRLAVAADPVRVITVGRLIEVKGIRHGIEAVAALQADGMRVQYDIVGDGPLRAQLSDLSRKLRVSGTVRFHGAVARNRALDLMEQAHIYLAPGVETADGDAETQGVALLEAQATGLPVVAARIGGIPDTIGQGACGALVEPGGTALAEGLRTVLQQPERWPQWGLAGRDHVTAHYEQERLLDRLVEHYCELLA